MHEHEISSKNLLQITRSIYSTRKFEEVNYDFWQLHEKSIKNIKVYLTIENNEKSFDNLTRQMLNAWSNKKICSIQVYYSQ